MVDLEPFYHTAWAPTFVPSYIDCIGSNTSPWAPTFDIIAVLQELRDRIYPSSEHVIDKDGAVYHLVSSSRLFLHTDLDLILSTGPTACIRMAKFIQL